MLFALPDHDVLYRALLRRDGRYDGQAYVCVSTTGIFLQADMRGTQTESRELHFPSNDRRMYRSWIPRLQAMPTAAGCRVS